MTDKKILRAHRLAVGYDSGHYTAIKNIVRVSQRLRSKEGELTVPVEVINSWKPVTVAHRHRYREIEVVLDTDNSAAWTGQQVVSGDAASRAINEAEANDPIGYFVYQMKDTAGANISHSFATLKTWLTYWRRLISNEHGTQTQPTTIRFTCIGARTVSTVDLVEAVTGDYKLAGCTSVTVNGAACTNVLSVEEEFLSDMEPQTMPNVTNPVGMKEWTGKLWRIRVTVDSSTSIFDSYISDTSENAVLPTLILAFTGANQVGAAVTETVTYQATSYCYVSKVDPDPEVTWEATRNPTTYEVICIGTRSPVVA